MTMKLHKNLAVALLCCTPLVGAPLAANAQGFAGGPAVGYVPIDGNLHLPHASTLTDTGAGVFQFCDGAACTNSFTLSAVGGNTARFNGGVQLAGSALLYFLNRTNCQSPADGQLKCQNNGGTAAASFIGTTTNDNAVAGGIGEFICAQVWNGGSPAGCTTNTGTPVALVAGTPATITSISLTAGDWEVCAIGVALPLGTTTTVFQAAISLVAATVPSPNTPAIGSQQVDVSTTFTGNTQSLAVGCTRELLNATTTVYLVEELQGTGANGSGFGNIWARRSR